eukprot:jgi/Psemu1/31316/gm1.31316_g
MLTTLNTFYSNLWLLLGSVNAFIKLFPPAIVWWLEPTDGLCKMAAKKTIECLRVPLKSATLAPAASTLIDELLDTSDNLRNSPGGNYAHAGSSTPHLHHALMQLLQYLPLPPLPAAIAALTHRPPSPPQVLTAHDPVVIPIGTIITGTNGLASYSLVVSTDRIKVFPNVNKTQLTLNPQTAPAALTTAPATPGLVLVPLPANKLATTIHTNETVKFLCFRVTTSTDGNPHYLLFGAYVWGAHLLFTCCARSRTLLLQLTQDKSNWFNATMITGYYVWNIGTTVAHVYHFDPTSTPSPINELPLPRSQTNTLTTSPPNPEATHLLSPILPCVHHLEATPHLRVARRLCTQYSPNPDLLPPLGFGSTLTKRNYYT